MTEERFKDNVSRIRNHKHLEAILSEMTRLRTTDDWVKAVKKIDVPCGPVNSIDQVAEDPHTLTREMNASVKHRKAGMLKVVNNPVKLSRTPMVLENASPDLGEHTDEVLRICWDLAGKKSLG